jgi:membrane protein YdbS with pleckstrin-like domain
LLVRVDDEAGSPEVSYPEKLLAPEEQVVEHLHPHWITLVPATLWFLVICAAGGFAIAFLPSGSAHSILLIVVLVVGIALLSWLSFAPWLRWRTTHYVMTTHRVLIRSGVLHHKGRDIPLQRINDVGFQQTLWDRIVRAGSLTIESAGEHGQETLRDIPNSERVQQSLNHLIEQDSDRRSRLGPASPYAAQPTGDPGQNPANAQYQQYPPNYQPPGPYPPNYQPGPGYPPGQYPQQPGPGGQPYPPSNPYPPR